MRLSTVLELLVIALLIAFMASELDARVIDGPDSSKILAKPSEHRFAIRKDRQRQVPDALLNETPGGTTAPSKLCSCVSLACKCCRQFAFPVVPVKGPGCATISYLNDNKMLVTMSFGDRVLRNITVNSRKPKPICIPMPGGISKFCGRLYSIKRDGDNFKACLGLELRALADVEAALRVSCFKFGPGGVNVEPGEAVPVDKVKEEEDEDDDDYGFDLDDDDDDDDDDDFGLTGDDDDDDDEEEDEKPPAKDSSVYNDVDSSDSDADYTGFGTLSEELFGGFFGSSGKKKKPVKNYHQEQLTLAETINGQTEKVQTQAPVVIQTESSRPIQRKPAKKPAKVNPTTATPTKKPKPTTTASVKRTKTTPSPVKALATSTTPATTAQVSSTTSKPLKKKKRPTRRRPGTSKPSTSTEAPTVITATAMTVSVVQGGLVLNETKPQSNPNKDTNLKIPMSKPVVETKPVEPVLQFQVPLMSSDNILSSVGIDKTNAVTEAINSYTKEVSTQAVMQNTIPSDEVLADNLRSPDESISVKIPIEQQDKFTKYDELTNTTPSNEYATEVPVSEESTVNAGSLSNIDITTDSNVEEMTTSRSTNELQSETFKNEQLDTDYFDNVASTQSLSYVTEPTEVTGEGTDKTEIITKESNKQEDQESVSDEGSENNDDDDDDDGIDFGTELGLDDDEEEDESSSEKNREENLNSKEKNEDDDDDDGILGGLLDEEDDDDEKKTKIKTNGQERRLGSQVTYQINPMLYRLARVSSGSIATARHLPMFSEGRNRRNNKRMRFPSLETV